MPRQKLMRKIGKLPEFRGFNPMGKVGDISPVVMCLEEYESIRLSDYANLSQVEASVTMGVSRPTYTRIYDIARKKIAQAFVEGRPIVFEGGKVYFDSDWFHCNSCDCYFDHLRKELIVEKCALCGSSDIEQCLDMKMEADQTEVICVDGKRGAAKGCRRRGMFN
ncbi:MAG: DUF134 domain-containing protein [Bacteroidales bacterium]|nr:DUF134 domain-containing protein [Bacteroidales bacterium]